MELVDTFTHSADNIKTIRVRNLTETGIKVCFEKARQEILVEVWGDPQTTNVSVDYEGDFYLEIRREPSTRKNASVVLYVPTSFQRNEHRKTFTLVSKS